MSSKTKDNECNWKVFSLNFFTGGEYVDLRNDPIAKIWLMTNLIICPITLMGIPIGQFEDFKTFKSNYEKKRYDDWKEGVKK